MFLDVVASPVEAAMEGISAGQIAVIAVVAVALIVGIVVIVKKTAKKGK